MPGVVYLPEADADFYVREGVLTEQTLIAAFRDSFIRNADRVALADVDGVTTYRELDVRSDQGAAALWNLGLRPLDRILFQVRNSRALIEAFFACLKIGVIPVCTLAAHREAEIGYIGRHTEAKAHFVHGDDPRFDMIAFARKLRSELPAVEQIVVVGGEGADDAPSFARLADAEDPQNARKLVEAIDLDPWQAALFQLSGGTSGIPKIIPRFNNEYRYSMQTVVDFIPLGRDVVAFTPNPLMHNAPTLCVWGPALLAGGEVAVATGPQLADIEALLAARRPTWILMAKVHQLRLYESGALNRLSFDNVLGFPVPDSAVELSRMLGANCYPIYGMTEGILAFGRPGDPQEAIASTVGRSSSPYDQIRIVAPETETDVPAGEVGELLLKGPCSLRGYYNAPERNAEIITSDGYYRSGDLMSFKSNDGTPYLLFHGRVKDVVDRGGEKINCSEVELAIAQHPDVTAVACVGMPDPLYGERMCAFVRARDGGQHLDLADITQHLAGLGLAKFKWPERLELIDELPMTTSGKVSKPLMRAMIAAQLRAEQKADATGAPAVTTVG